MAHPFAPEQVLIDWKDARGGYTVTDAQAGVAVFGATGSGKTSGPGALLAKAYLKAGMGGLVLCAKAEERGQWQGWVRNAGRERDLVVFDAGGSERFDFLAWEAGRAREGGGQVINTVLLLDEIAAVAARASGAGTGGGGGDSAFFKDALHLMLVALVALAAAGEGPVTLQRLRELHGSAPRGMAQIRSKEWQERSPMARELMRLAMLDARQPDPERRADLAEIFAYWTGDYPELSDRTRSIIDMMFSMAVQPFLYSPLRQIFTGGGGTISPEAAFDGKIIVIDLPVQDLRIAGKVAALVWKHCFQIAVMRRSGPRGTLRPVFLWADEAQNFITERDAEYQAVARSAGGCTVYLTQQYESISELIGKGATENLLSNLQTKFFCQNTGSTNEWAGKLIGERYRQVTNTSWGGAAQHGEGGPSGQGSTQAGISRSEQKRAYIEPSRFQSLRRGGPSNDHQVDAVVFCGGKLFGQGEGEPLPYKILTFRQKG
jgi:hypothetical protein